MSERSTIGPDAPPSREAPPDLSAIHRAGGRAAGTLQAGPPNPKVERKMTARVEAARSALRAALADPSRQHLADSRLVATALKETRTLGKATRSYPTARCPFAELVPRVSAVADAYLDHVAGRFSDETAIAFMAGFQEIQELEMGELWALKPALLFALLERLAANPENPAELIDSLRLLGESSWKDTFEAMSVVDHLLARDPAGAYSSMDYESRDLYRNVISELAESSTRTEREVAQCALEFAQDAASPHVTGPAAERRTHVGFYLIDRGLPSLQEKVKYRPPLSARVREYILRNPTYVYLLGVEIVTMIIVYSMLSGLERLTPVFAGFFLLILPATQAAVDFMNNLATSLTRPRALPKLDLSHGIPPDCATMVAIPTLLLSESQLRGLVMDLEIRYLANRGPNLYFALITDSPDSDQAVDEKDRLVEVCEALIRDLNDRYGTGGKTPFYLLHRHRIYNPSERRWMGWERKRGKLLDLNQLLRGGYDSFPVKVGDLSVLPGIRYVITLDSDTQLPRDAARRFVGTIAHPLNRAVLDPATKMVVEGYGILQPRIGVSIESASRSVLASLYSGQTGFDIYTRAVSDVYQDLFGEGIFTGKGIYDVDVFRDSLEQRFPDNTLLSHDLIEGTFARAALVSDIELIDDYPTHFSAYNKRKHRWMRGDWQILRWIMARVPDRDGNLVPNPVSLISRWKIIDNLRRSLFEPATLLLLLSGWLYLPGPVRFWTLASIAMLLMPAYSGLLFAAIRAPWGKPEFSAWVRETFKTFAREHFIVFLHLTFLLHDALLAIDAVIRSLARVFVTRKKLLEWETAAEAEASQRRKGAADLYLRWSPWLALLLTVVMWFVRPVALPVALPILGAWVCSPLLSYWLGLPPSSARVGLSSDDVARLRSSALRTWRFFSEFSSPATHWLIPDNVREDGAVAHRISPTNLGFLLNARIAALHFGYLTLPEFVEQTRHTLDSALELPRVRGHFLNWYGTDRLEALEPRFVSTVDSGNLAACLWTLKQACLALAAKPLDEAVLWSGIRDLAGQLGSGPDPGGQALRDRILRTDAGWKEALPQLEELTRHFAETAAPETAWWANELALRIEKARAWFNEGLTEELGTSLTSIAASADRLTTDMDFSFLYDPRKKVATVGYNESAGKLEPSTYDLLASESRIASFVAIAKGEFPQESWFHLGRRHTISRGQRVLVSWTGTMFEYLMPALWMKHSPQTIMHDSLKSAVRLQRRYTARLRIPWGISESACCSAGSCEYGYAAFGLPDLAMKRLDPKSVVISPYSSFLALLVNARAAAANLRRMESMGWTGTYGFYEAADFSNGSPEIVRSWMAHHQGMSLLAIANVLFDNPFQRYFHAEPYVLATELLLHERVPAGLVTEVEELPEAAS